MHPRSDNNQRCLSFSLSVSPRCRVFSYRDHLGNNVHHFDIPGEHSQLVMVAEALVEQQPLPEIPQTLPGSGHADVRAARPAPRSARSTSPTSSARASAPKPKRATVGEAHEPLVDAEAEKMLDQEAVMREAIGEVESNGIVFLDEIDKICGRDGRSGATSHARACSAICCR